MSRVVYVALQQFCESDAEPQRVLQEAGFEIRTNALERRLRREDMPSELRGADAVIAGVESYDAGLLASLSRLRCISRCGVGTDTIDLEAARRLGIAVYTTPHEVVEPVAELTVTMMLALARNVPQHLRELHGGRWVKHTGVLLSEWTVGLVGFGRIGQAVERLLRPFGPRVLAADPRLAPADLPPGVSLRTLHALLAEADVVSLHAARRPEDGPLVGPAEVWAMKPGARLINTSRGYVIDEAAVEAALRAGRLAGAALDVFTDEPYAGPLARLPNVLCTPHIATLTRASRAAMERRAAAQVVQHFLAARSPMAAAATASAGR